MQCSECPPALAEKLARIPLPAELGEEDLERASKLAPFAVDVGSNAHPELVTLIAGQTDLHPFSMISPGLATSLDIAGPDPRVHLRIAGYENHEWPVDIRQIEHAGFSQDFLFGRDLGTAADAQHSDGPMLTARAELSDLYKRAARVRLRSVLVLGEDTSRVGQLRSIQRWLDNHGFQSVLVKDLPDIPEQTVEEKVALLASLCSFVVCDDAVPSGHIDELHMMSQLRIVTAILSPEGAGGTWMQADYDLDRSFLRRFRYASSPEDSLHLATDWALTQQAERRQHLNGLYPWR